MIFAASVSQARGQVHPAEPAVNLGDTSFLDGIAGPGWLLEEIGDAAHSKSSRAGDGSGGPEAPTVNSISGITHIAWVSHRHLLGGWYGVEMLESATHVNAGAMGVAGGVGDLTVSPLILQWKERSFGQFSLAQRVVFDFDLPTGAYDRSQRVNLSSHAFTVHPYYAVTVLAGKRIESSWRMHYLWNATNDAPPYATGAKSTQAGQALHFNGTVGYALASDFWAGANGYFLKQVTAPQADGRGVLDSPEQVGAIGPGVLWDLGRYLLYANFYREFGALNRPQENKLVLRVQWVPGRHRGGAH